MSSFFIKIENGSPVGDPMPLSSVRSLGYFEKQYRNGEIPEDYEPMRPVPEPMVPWFQVVECDGELHKIDGVWQKVYDVRKMTEDELAEYRAKVEAEWADHLAYPSWSYNEETGQMSPPVHPEPEMQRPQWDEATQTWSEGTDPVDA
tara:strand:- start:17981 stop:18421 length:441 start_codon:yes stop_codon:yes gene_type:complete